MQKSYTFRLVERISMLLRAEERKKYVALGLQPIHAQILDYLGRCNHHSDTPAAVTEYLGLTKGTVSQSITLLENKGYVAKTQDEEDGRVSHLALTEAGWELLEHAKPHDFFAEAEQAVSSNKFASLAEALEPILATLLSAGNCRTFGECKTCLHFIVVDNHYQCGLTELPLSWRDSEKICRNHEPLPAC
ncbi:MAG: MarR family transcriptional regulator [Methylobacter sp.]|nr:MAG: MarR family transcriptional regulator [Methylobacter sp.]